MASQLAAVYQDMTKVADMAGTIGSTLSDIDNVANPIALALIASAAIGDEIGAALGGTYEDSIHPTLQTIIGVCNEVHDFIYQATSKIQQADQDASSALNGIGSIAGPLSSLL